MKKTKKRVDYFAIRLFGVHRSTAGFIAEQRDGVSISETGRLCSWLSNKTKRFDTRREAIIFFNQTSYKDKYQFEVVECSGWFND